MGQDWVVLGALDDDGDDDGDDDDEVLSVGQD